MASSSSDSRRSKDSLVDGDLWTFVKETFPLSDWQKATKHNVDQWLDKSKYDDWRFRRGLVVAPAVATQLPPRFRGFVEPKGKPLPSFEPPEPMQIDNERETYPHVPEISPSPSPSPSPTPPPQGIAMNHFASWTDNVLARLHSSPPQGIRRDPRGQASRNDGHTFVNQSRGPDDSHSAPSFHPRPPWEDYRFSQTRASRDDWHDSEHHDSGPYPARPDISGERYAARYHNGHAAFSAFRWQGKEAPVQEDDGANKFSLRTVTWDARPHAAQRHYRPHTHQGSQLPPLPVISAPQAVTRGQSDSQPSVSPVAQVAMETQSNAPLAQSSAIQQVLTTPPQSDAPSAQSPVAQVATKPQFDSPPPQSPMAQDATNPQFDAPLARSPVAQAAPRPESNEQPSLSPVAPVAQKPQSNASPGQSPVSQATRPQFPAPPASPPVGDAATSPQINDPLSLPQASRAATRSPSHSPSTPILYPAPPVVFAPIPQVAQAPRLPIPLQPAESNSQSRVPSPRRERAAKRKRTTSPSRQVTPKSTSRNSQTPTSELTVHMEYPLPVPAQPVQLNLARVSSSIPTSLSDLVLPNIKRTRPLPKPTPKPPAKGHYEGFCSQFWVDEVDEDDAHLRPFGGASVQYPIPPQYYPPGPAYPYGPSYGGYYPGSIGYPPPSYPYAGYPSPYYYPPGMLQPPGGYPMHGQAPLYQPSQSSATAALWNPYAPVGTVQHPHFPPPLPGTQPSPGHSFQASDIAPEPSSSIVPNAATAAPADNQPLVTEFYVGPLARQPFSSRPRKSNSASKQSNLQYPPEIDAGRLKTITYPLQTWTKPIDADGYYLDMSRVDDGLWWQPSLTGWQSILRIVFHMDRDAWKNVANNSKGPLMSDVMGVSCKWKYYECKGVSYCETLDIDSLIPPAYVRVEGDKDEFASKATYSRLARGEEVCAGMVSPAVGQEDDECRYPHNEKRLAKMKARKCPAKMYILTAAEDIMDHRAIIAFGGVHNHPEFPKLEPMVKPIRKQGWKRWHREVPMVTSSGFYGNTAPYDAPTQQSFSAQ